MKLASVAEARNGLTRLMKEAHRKREGVLITRHGKPYALISPLGESDLEHLDWDRLSRASLNRAWEGDQDRLYDYL